ncbi:cation:proton antiporter, partial [Brevirhabdus pacifica]
MEGFLLQATIYLGAAVISVPIAARLGLGSVLGYLLAGIVIGPALGLVGSEAEGLRHFAEFGVVMMLFLIGLELEPRALWDMRHRLLGLGGLQVTLTMAAVTSGALLLGQPLGGATAIGMIFALSSTAIVLQTLSEKNLMQTPGGRSSFSVLLTQDIAVIPMLVLLPLLATGGGSSSGGGGGGHGAEPAGLPPQVGEVIGEPGTGNARADAAMKLVEELPGWGAALLTMGVILGIILVGTFLTRPVFRYIHAAHLRELNTALALLMVTAIGFSMSLVGLSPALGTFLTGVVLANTEFRHELQADIEPFKGLLLGLFFITVGAGVSFELLREQPVLILSLTLALVAVKGTILYGLGRVFKLRGRNLWLFTLGLAQAGEFGFVLVSFSQQQQVLERSLGELLLLVVAVSMLLTPLLFIVYDRISKRSRDAAGDGGPEAYDTVDAKGSIIIAGVGRFGQIVNRMVRAAGFETTVLDHDLKTIQLMRKFGFKGFFGDPTRPELLHAAGLEEARVLVVALDDPASAVRLVKLARKERPDLHIVARARHRVHAFELYAAGADDIVRELFDSSLRAARYVLENSGLTEYEAAAHQRAFYHHDRAALAELAQLWVPGRPVAENEAYIARSKQLNKEMEADLVAALDDHGRAEERDEDAAIAGPLAGASADGPDTDGRHRRQASRPDTEGHEPGPDPAEMSADV